jgi:cysteinyl-tRNA synthetase
MNISLWLAAALLLVMTAVVGWQNFNTSRSAKLSAGIGRELLASNSEIYMQASHANFDTAKALADIHKLVNSNLAAARQRELDATRRDLASLQEVVSLKESQGIPVSAESMAVIDEVKARIEEMTRAAVRTEQQTEKADDQ